MWQRTDLLTSVLHSETMHIKLKVIKFLTMAAMTLSLALTPLYGGAQENNNTSGGQMKESGSEVKKPAKAWAIT